MPKMMTAFTSADLKATFFMVADDLAGNKAVRDFCSRAIENGHEIANHSLTHYGFIDESRINYEIEKSHDIISSACNMKPCGYRSPGYNISNGLFNALAKHEYTYDSSVLPGWGTALMRINRYPHKSKFKKSLGSWRDLLAGANIRSVRTDYGSLVEIPVSITPFLRMPFYPTMAYAFGLKYIKLCLALVKRARPQYCLFLFHAVDLMDLTDSAFSNLIFARWPLDQKRELFRYYLKEASLIGPNQLTRDYVTSSGHMSEDT